LLRRTLSTRSQSPRSGKLTTQSRVLELCFEPFLVRGTLQVFKEIGVTTNWWKDNFEAPYVIKHQ
jgi:hypothetical protein